MKIIQRLGTNQKTICINPQPIFPKFAACQRHGSGEDGSEDRLLYSYVTNTNKASLR
jgi:hypothetical protein